MTDRQRLLELVSELPKEEVRPAIRYIQFLRMESDDPVSRAVAAAPEDDEPLRDEEREALEEALADESEGRLISQAELEAELHA